LDNNVNVNLMSSNQIILETQSDQPGILVLSEMYYAPGWKAFIDDVETEIFQANHVLRAIVLPAGDHKIDFRYDDRLWNATRMLSRTLFVLVILILLVVHRKNIMKMLPLKK